MKYFSYFFILISIASCSFIITEEPICSGAEGWPASIAYTKLKNAKLLSLPINPDKTKVSRIMGERIGANLYRQLHQIEFSGVSNETIKVLTISDASSDECSMSEVKVFIIESTL